MTSPSTKVGAGLLASTLVVAGWSSALPTLNSSKAPDSSSDPSPSAAEPHAATPSCIRVRAEARRGVAGYDHWVFIDSDCDLAAACDVSTDVAPESMTVTVQPRSTASVLTATEADAPKFAPYVTCQLGPAD